MLDKNTNQSKVRSPESSSTIPQSGWAQMNKWLASSLILVILLLGVMIVDNLILRVRNNMLNDKVLEMESFIIELSPKIRTINKTLESLTIPNQLRKIKSLQKNNPIIILESYYKGKPLYDTKN